MKTVKVGVRLKFRSLSKVSEDTICPDYYTLDVDVSGLVNDTGIVINKELLSEIIRSEIIDPLEYHTYVTLEVLTLWIWETLEKNLSADYRTCFDVFLERVRLWNDKNQYVELEK